MPLKPIVLICSVVFALAECSQARDLQTGRQPVAVTAEAMPLDRTRPNRARLGPLRYRGGVWLKSGHTAFGGLSGLWVAPDDSRFLAVSDHGFWVRGDLIQDGEGGLADVKNVTLGNLRGLRGAPLAGTEGHDAEALARTAEGDFLVAFERRHRVLAYDGAGASPPLDGPGRRMTVPADLHRAPPNGGAEALAVLDDGRWVLLSEDLVIDGRRLAFLRDTSGGWHTMTLPGRGGYKPTDAAQLPGGDLLVLERRFDLLAGFAARLRRVPAAHLTPGGTLAGPVVADFKAPLTVDNFEGLAITGGGEGRPPHVYLVSDDNYRGLQRTLLMMFEWAPTTP